MSGKTGILYLPVIYVSDSSNGMKELELPEQSIVLLNKSHPAYKAMEDSLKKEYFGLYGKKHYGTSALKEGEWEDGPWWNYGYSIKEIPTTVYTDSFAGGKRVKTRRNKGRK